MSHSNLSVALLHEQMVDKQGKFVTTSLTLNDIQDLARSVRSYGAKELFIAHPSAALRKLARRVELHWEQGFGATYNPTRKEALSTVRIVSSLDEALIHIERDTGSLPQLIATSAREGGKRIDFQNLRKLIEQGKTHYLLMLGSGWGMSEELLARADLFLEPIRTSSDFNHLSVRAAGAILLDRLVGQR